MSPLSELYQNSQISTALHAEDVVQGMIFGVCATPEIPMPEQWMPWTFAQHQQLCEEAQINKITEVLMQQMAETLQDMSQGNIAFITQWEYDENSQTVNTPCQLFLAGLLLAHEQCEAMWQAAWQKLPTEEQTVQADNLTHCLNMFSTFVDVTVALERAGDNASTLAAALPQIFAELPEAIMQYNELSGLLARYLPNQLEQFANPFSTE